MSPIRAIFLSLPEIEAQVSRYEEKYGFSTADFLRRRDELVTQMEEDDVFKWEAYIAHWRELRHFDDDVRRDYLSKVTQDEQAKAPTPEDQLLLAA